MIDLPAHFQEQLAKIDWAKVQEKVADYGPALRVIKETWDRETLAEISQGNLFVSDDMLNEALAKNIKEGGPAKSVKLKSAEDGSLAITVDTVKLGPVELNGQVQEFVHNGDRSWMVYKVRQRNIPNHGLMSWVFSRVSLAMAQRMVGSVQLSDDVPVTIKHNTVTIDYSKVLAASQLGTTRFHGHRLLDMVEIEKAVPKEGGIMFQTRLNVPDDVKKDLRAILPQQDK